MNWKAYRDYKEDPCLQRAALHAGQACEGWPCFPLSLHSAFLGSSQVKMRDTETVWQLMNNINLPQDEHRRLCSVTEKVFLLLRDNISSVPNISPFASS